MIHDSEKESVFKCLAERSSDLGVSAVRLSGSSEPSRRSHDAIIRLYKNIAEDVRKRTHRHQTHRYYHSTRHLMQSLPPILTSKKRATSARQLSPQELAERAAVILALNITSGKKPNQS